MIFTDCEPLRRVFGRDNVLPRRRVQRPMHQAILQ